MTTCKLSRQRKLSRRVRTPRALLDPRLARKVRVFFWTQNVDGELEECPAESESLPETQPTLRHAFRHVYGFILQAVRGDKAAADAIFENYLAGKLSEELLSISRRCVSQIKQAHLGARSRKGIGRSRDN